MKTTLDTNLLRLGMFVLALGLVLSACAPSAPPSPAPKQDISQVQTQAAQTVVADLTKNAPPPPTQTAPPPGPTMDPNVPVAVIPSPESGDPSVTATYDTSIYSGPGTDYVLYGAFPEGQSAIVVGKSEDGQWWAISVPVAPTGAGWVSAGWVSAQNANDVPVLPTPPPPPTTEMVPPGPSDPQATALVNTNVRSGPAVNFPAYGVAKAGATARVIGKSEDGRWWVVRLNPENVGAGYGWVDGQYVKTSNTDGVQTIENPDTPVSAAPEAPAAKSTTLPAATTTDYVNVRTGPGTNYPVIVVAPPGTTGEITGKSADGAWWQVKVPVQYSVSGAGWVSASYVTVQNTTNVPVVAAPPPPPPVPSAPPGVTGPVCKIDSQTPVNGTTYNADTPFTTTWVLVNTGDKWSDGEVDLRYLGAYNNVQLHTGGDLYDLSNSVKTGQSYNFSVPMIAPWSAGTYGELWEVGSGSKSICQFYVYINVP